MGVVDPFMMLVVTTATSPTLSRAIDAIVPIYVIVALSVIWATYSDDLSRKPATSSSTSDATSTGASSKGRQSTAAQSNSSSPSAGASDAAASPKQSE